MGFYASAFSTNARAPVGGETRTGADGSYRFASIPAGTYELGVQLSPQSNFQWQNVDVSGTGETQVEPIAAQWRLYLPTLKANTSSANQQSFLDTLRWWIYLPAASR